MTSVLSPRFIARLIGQQLTERMGQPVIVENKVGAGGNIAAEFVAKAAPDGYTLFLGAANMSINASYYKNLRYSPANDFTLIDLISTVPMVLVVPPSLPVKDFKEFLSHARSRQDGNQRDYPVVIAGVFVISCTFVLVNLIVDLLYSFLDPRVRVA